MRGTHTGAGGTPGGAAARGKGRPAAAAQPRLPGLADTVALSVGPVAVVPVAKAPRAMTHLRPADVRATPPRPAPRVRATVGACFGELRGALAEGWVIVQPIFARPLWSVTDDSTTAFNFVLRRERATRLVIVPEGRTVARFIRDQHLNVDYGCS